MKLSIKNSLLNDVITEGKFPGIERFCQRGGMSEVNRRTGLNYQTVMKLVKGTFGLRMLSILGRYLSALGYKAKDVEQMRIGDVFDLDD